MGTVDFPMGQSGQGMKLNVYFHVTLRLKMNGAIRQLLLYLYGMYKDNFILHYFEINYK
jgi:hypothetical protein